MRLSIEVSASRTRGNTELRRCDDAILAHASDTKMRKDTTGSSKLSLGAFHLY